jgi:hypothetical protein
MARTRPVASSGCIWWTRTSVPIPGASQRARKPQRTIAEWELGGDLPGQYARTSRTLSGADLIPCTRCRLRGHTAGDPDKCYQPVSFGLGQWADEPAVSVSGKKGGAP